jgi:hypothetical protein
VNVIGVEVVVRPKRVAIDHRSGFDVVVYLASQRFAFDVRNNHRSNFAVPFKQSHNRHLALEASRALESARFNAAMHVASLAADKCFIDFDVAGHLFHKRSGVHGESNAVIHEPRGFLRHAKRPRNLITTDSVFTIDDQPNGGQPLIQTKRRIFKDGSDLDGELPLPVRAFALPLVLFLKERHVLAPTSRTSNAIRPSASRKVVEAILRIREVNDCLLKCLRCVSVCHDVRILAKAA